MSKISRNVIRAVAESWASIDGKLDRYINDPENYSGYDNDAEELIKRIEKRGYKLVPLTDNT